MPVCFNLELLIWKSQDQPAHNVPSELDRFSEMIYYVFIAEMPVCFSLELLIWKSRDQPAHNMLSDLDRFSKMIYFVDFYRRNACMF